MGVVCCGVLWCGVLWCGLWEWGAGCGVCMLPPSLPPSTYALCLLPPPPPLAQVLQVLRDAFSTLPSRVRLVVSSQVQGSALEHIASSLEAVFTPRLLEPSHFMPQAQVRGPGAWVWGAGGQVYGARVWGIGASVLGTGVWGAGGQV